MSAPEFQTQSLHFSGISSISHCSQVLPIQVLQMFAILDLTKPSTTEMNESYFLYYIGFQ